MSARLLAGVGVALLLIAPRVQGDPEYGDIRFERKGNAATADYPPAVFPHWVHRMQFRCYACHNDLFEMKAGANAITMARIEEGAFCGSCHNGKIAFSVVFDTCTRCHRP